MSNIEDSVRAMGDTLDPHGPFDLMGEIKGVLFDLKK